MSITGFITCLICASALTLVAATSKGQTALDKKVTISIKDQSLENAFEQLAKVASVNISYGDNRALEDRLSISAKDEKLGTVLDRLLSNRPFSYVSIDDKIIIRFTPDKPKTEKVVPPSGVTGKVMDEKGQPLPGVTIRIKSTGQIAYTNENGDFRLNNLSDSATLVFSFIGFLPQEVKVTGITTNLNISLKQDIAALKEVSVVSTGYQEIPKERATGSFEHLNNSLINRRVSSNILDKLENVASGFYTNQNDVGPDKYVIRGRSTIFADPTPLIVLDNFPFDGSVDDINPNDVESITILKDAAAASIWGARAGNGVIVITTKAGKTAKPSIQLVGNVTVTQRPNLYSLPLISSSDYIDLEKKLFSLGYYQADEDMNAQGYLFPSFTPVVELLRKKRDGSISSQTADTQIESYKQYDVRDDLKKYFYQNSVNQQYALNVSGKTESVNYYVSAGFDKGITNLVSQGTDRITLRNRSTFQLTKKLNIETGLNFIQYTYQTGENLGIDMQSNTLKKLYPYAQLADQDGNALPVYDDFSQVFVNSVESKGLLNWDHRPLDEIGRRHKKTLTRELIANTGINYNIISGLNFSLRYQYLYSDNNTNDTRDQDSYYTRNLINKFTQVSTSGVLTRPIPLGDIISRQSLETFSHHARAQLGYDNQWSGKNQINAIAGWEISDVETKGFGNNYYGYDKKGSVSIANLDYVTLFPQYQYGILAPNVTATIPNQSSISGTTDRYYSYFANASYSLKSRYIVSASAREDASNLFGVKTNQQQVPLWSAGLAWDISKEPFYHSSLFPYLKLRISYGSQGNVSKKVSAYTTGTYGSFALTRLTNITIQTPPNESLRWETINMLNWGVDFSLKNNSLSGSIEYYIKRGHDLLGEAPLDPTTGFSVGSSAPAPRYFGNLAGIRGHGFDVKLNSSIINSIFNWNLNLLYSYTISKVSAYGVPVSIFGNAYLGDYMINPVLGQNVYAIYAFKWAGLDPQNGNPRGYLNGQVSSDVAAIYNQTPLSEMNSHSLQPSSFGALRNNFTYNNMFLSFNVSFKFGYYFRRPSLNYRQLFSSWSGSSDYAKRWQKPGDELTTNIPSMVYPASDSRDTFFMFSDALIEKADNIRVEDINAGYEFKKKHLGKMPFESVKIYAYISNLGVLWTANKAGIDPNNVYSLTPGKSFALGINVNF